jgi:hypothetical protein
LTDESEEGLLITSGLTKLIVDTYIYLNLYQSIKYLYTEFKQNYSGKEENQKSIMVSKRWLAFIGLILFFCFIDTIGIVTTRVIPNKYSNIEKEECVPSWAVMKKTILELLNPYVKLLQYIGFLSLFVR